MVVYKIDDDKLQVETKIFHVSEYFKNVIFQLIVLQVDVIVDFVALYAPGGRYLDEHWMPLDLSTAQHGNNYLLLVI